ncbi:MAG TPA: hypothetical protein VE972_03740 [Conexibacter sp.]|nr:hypothetical protein [Conexibacter sp.]
MAPTPDIDVLLPDDETVRARRDALVDELRRAPAPRLVVAPRRLALMLTLLMALGAGAAAASGVFSADDVKVEAGVGCYDRAALRATVSLMAATPDPVAACAALWREGYIDGRTTGDAPPLVACTGEDQPVRVMPGDGPKTCAGLGLEPLPADYPQAARTSSGATTAP